MDGRCLVNPSFPYNDHRLKGGSFSCHSHKSRNRKNRSELQLSQGFSNDFKEQVRSRTDIVGLVGESVSLNPQHSGADFIGLCPFHDDHRPSFHVYPDRQSYRCWVCDEGGDCFSFVMKIEGVDFLQALKILADKAGLQLPQRSHSANRPKHGVEKDKIHEILEWAANAFHEFLMTARDAENARQYLKERGFTGETVKKYRAGYHPEDWQWVLDRAQNRYSTEELLAARLIRERSNGPGFRDDFVDRVMFPIRNERGRTVAFGGRILPGSKRSETQKYLNSPESSVFSKSRLLYGLDLAKEPIRRRGEAVVVEGYTDCMMLHQHGLENVVATLGTSLTDQHVILLRRFAQKAVLVYDGDDAGLMAAERAVVRLLAQDVDLRILTLENGLDPADFVQQHGADRLKHEAQIAPEAWKFKLNRCREKFDPTSIHGRQQITTEFLSSIAQSPRLSGTLKEDMMLQQLSTTVGISEKKIREELKQTRSQQSRRVPSGNTKSSVLQSQGSEQPGTPHPLEQEILEAIFTEPKVVNYIRREITLDQIENLTVRKILEVCFAMDGEGRVPEFTKLLTRLEDPVLKSFAIKTEQLAQKKRTSEKIRMDAVSDSQSEIPFFLEKLVGDFHWRQKTAAFNETLHSRMQSHESTDRLDSRAKDVLREVTEYHKKRAVR